MIKYYKGQHIIHLTDAVLEQHRKQSSKKRILVDPGKLKWKPYVLLFVAHHYHILLVLMIRPVFSRAQLAFGF
jgi:histone acetyltransferase HTATIP